jgi:drug/metabolite transporter (DMT)-like permease
MKFYSQKSFFSSCIFIVSFFYILILNLVTYKKYGVLHQNEFYTTPYETLKTLHLFLCVLGGFIFFCFLNLLFFSYEQAVELKISSSTNTGLMTLISLFLVFCDFVFFGSKVKAMQVFGIFLSIIGLVIIFMALSDYGSTT